MNRATITFYLPEETFEVAKIDAVKAGTSFSDLDLRCVLDLIEHDAFKNQYPKPSTKKKTMIYLTHEEKKTVKPSINCWVF